MDLQNSDIQIDSEITLKKVLGDIDFRNTSLDFKWRFEIAPCNDPDMPGWFVNVAFERPDTHTGQVGIGRGRKEYIALNSWESGAVKTCWLLVELVVRHELMEAFNYKGKRIFNPHNSVHALASIQTAGMTKEQIERALIAYRPDQLDVIKSMAANRDLDPDNLTEAQYKALIMEEADFSQTVANHTGDAEEIEENRRYSQALKTIADAI